MSCSKISNESKNTFVWPNKRSLIPFFIHAHYNSRRYFIQVLCRLDNGDLAKKYPMTVVEVIHTC